MYILWWKVIICWPMYWSNTNLSLIRSPRPAEKSVELDVGPIHIPVPLIRVTICNAPCPPCLFIDLHSVGKKTMLPIVSSGIAFNLHTSQEDLIQKSWNASHTLCDVLLVFSYFSKEECILTQSKDLKLFLFFEIIVTPFSVFSIHFSCFSMMVRIWWTWWKQVWHAM